MNVVVINGRITYMDMKYTQSGKQVLSVGVAVKNRFNKDKTDFIDCVAWQKTAEIIDKYMNVGDGIIVNGNINVDSYKDVNGKRRKNYTINIENFNFGVKSKKNTNDKEEVEDYPEVEYEDLPF